MGTQKAAASLTKLLFRSRVFRETSAPLLAPLSRNALLMFQMELPQTLSALSPHPAAESTALLSAAQAARTMPSAEPTHLARQSLELASAPTMTRKPQGFAMRIWQLSTY